MFKDGICLQQTRGLQNIMLLHPSNCLSSLEFNSENSACGWEVHKIGNVMGSDWDLGAVGKRHPGGDDIGVQPEC